MTHACSLHIATTPCSQIRISLIPRQRMQRHIDRPRRSPSRFCPYFPTLASFSSRHMKAHDAKYFAVLPCTSPVTNLSALPQAFVRNTQAGLAQRRNLLTGRTEPAVGHFFAIRSGRRKNRSPQNWANVRYKHSTVWLRFTEGAPVLMEPILDGETAVPSMGIYLLAGCICRVQVEASSLRSR